MEGKRRPGRPRKQQPVAPQITCYDTETEKITRSSTQKYPMNPDPDISRIRRLVVDCLKMIEKPDDPIDINDFLGARYARNFGCCEHTLKLIAEELGVRV